MSLEPWCKATLSFTGAGGPLDFQVPHDAFSTLQIDDGTLLLLDHLPAGSPESVLDLGCGYGALGLPIAARFPGARVELVDRDLLVVGFSEINARQNHLTNVDVHGSLGFRSVRGGAGAYDWVLCNVPARIGRPFIQNLIDSGRILLKPSGELRVVVIHDLAPVMLELQQQQDWPLREITKGSRHTVFAIGAKSQLSIPAEPADLYLRDQVQVDGISLDRPYDSGGDDPKRLNFGFPLFLEALARHAGGRQDPPARICCFRSSYGQFAALAQRRWPGASVVAVERDLLAAEFTRRNFHGASIEVREQAHFPDALKKDERFDLILGELNSSAGEAVAISELQAIENALNPQGQALLLSFDRPARNWVLPYAKRTARPARPQFQSLGARDAYTVLRLANGG